MIRIALRNVRAHRSRLLMTFVAVALGVAFVSGTLVFGETVRAGYERQLAGGPGSLALEVSEDDDGPGPPGAPRRGAPVLSDALLRKVRSVPGAGDAFGTLSGFTAVADRQGDMVGEPGRARGTNTAPGPDGRFTFTAGHAPHRGGETALNDRAADAGGYQLGDKVRLSADGVVRELRLTGTFADSSPGVPAEGTLTLFDTATARDVLHRPTGYDRFVVPPAGGRATARALARQLQHLMPQGVKVRTGDQVADAEARQAAGHTRLLTEGLMYFAVLALFVSIFLITNTYSMLISRRTRELALLRAVGAGRAQVRRLVLLEALQVGLAASAAGFGLGLLVSTGLRAGLDALGHHLPDGPPQITPAAVVASLSLGVGVTLLAAWLPARRAARIPPMAALRAAHEPAGTRALVRRGVTGGCLTALGVLAMTVGTSDASAAAPLLALGALVSMAGAVVLTPVLAGPFMAAAGFLLGRRGVPGRLARRNAVRDPRRTAGTAAALMIGLALVTGTTVFATSVQNALGRTAADSLKGDYLVRSADSTELSPEVARTLAALPGTASVTPQRRARATTGTHESQVTGVDPRTVRGLLGLRFTDGSFDGFGDRSVVLDAGTARREHARAGSEIPVTFGDGVTERLVVAGSYEEDGSGTGGGLYVPLALVDRHAPTAMDTSVLVRTMTGASQESQHALVHALGDNPALQVKDGQALSEETGDQVRVMLGSLYGLLAMVVLVAVLGVANTTALSITERRREIATLRAVGMDRSGLRRMIRLEAVAISLFGAVLGVGAGLFLAAEVSAPLAASLPTYEMLVPYGPLALFLGGALLIGVLAAAAPARSAARQDIVRAMQTDG